MHVVYCFCGLFVSVVTGLDGDCPIPKGQPFSSVANYRPISITSVLSTELERLVLFGHWSGHFILLRRLMEGSGVLPTTQFAYRKGLGTCDAFVCMSYTLQNALESGQMLRSGRLIFEQP